MVLMGNMNQRGKKDHLLGIESTIEDQHYTASITQAAGALWVSTHRVPNHQKARVFDNSKNEIKLNY